MESAIPEKPQANGRNPINCSSSPEGLTLEQSLALCYIQEGEADDKAVYRSGIGTLRSSAHRVKANPKSRKQNPNPKDKSGRQTNKTQLPSPLYQEKVFPFEMARYNLRQAFVDLLKTCDASIVGSFRPNDDDKEELEDFLIPVQTLHRKVNGGSCEKTQAYMSDLIAKDTNFLQIFDDLVEQVVLPYMKERLIDAGAASHERPLSFYIQRPPTLRIQPGPGRAGVKPHHDGEYGHQNGELNFWLPLTDRNQNNVDLWCESSHKADDFHRVIAQLGEIISFHGSSCRHFVNRNESDKTRVSLDFRIGVEGFFDPYWQMNGTNDDHHRREVRL